MTSDSTALGVLEERGLVLLQVARASLVEAFGGQAWTPPEEDRETWLREERATFVTLTKGLRLRGCIGTLRAHRTLFEDVRENARAAAFNDTRFSPLTGPELDDTLVEVSLLSPLAVLPAETEADLLEAVRPGVDGLVLEYETQRGTFLPQVWEAFPDRQTFVGQLKRKAGLTPDFWHPRIRVWRYAVTKWREGSGLVT